MKLDAPIDTVACIGTPGGDWIAMAMHVIERSAARLGRIQGTVFSIQQTFAGRWHDWISPIPAERSEMPVLRSFSGACVRRVIDPGRAVVAEHAHDWPLVSLYVIGAYRSLTELGEREVAGPSMVFYGAGVAHRNVAGELGFEQIEIEFDPRWLGDCALPPAGLLLRVGGRCGALARAMAGPCEARLSEADLRASLRRLLAIARSEPAMPVRAWAGDVTAHLRADPCRRIGDLARELGRSPAWIGPAYRHSIGESPQQAAARFRVERAVHLLRETDLELSRIAADTGFCDQSHMNRVVRRVLGRSPLAVRRERAAFRDAATIETFTAPDPQR